MKAVWETLLLLEITLWISPSALLYLGFVRSRLLFGVANQVLVLPVLSSAVREDTQ